MGKKKGKHKKEAKRVAATLAPVRVASTDVSARAMGGGRVSIDTADSVYTSALEVVSPISSDEYWRNYNLDSRTFDRLSIPRLMELLIDLSPDVSNGLFQFIRFCNPGFEKKAYKPGTKDVDKKAQKALDSFISNLHGPYPASNSVPVDVVIGLLYLSAWVRGALCSELVLSEDGRMPLELATPDPATIKFKRVADSLRGYVWQPGQYQKGQFVALTRPTFSYIPIDPLPGRAEGRAIAQAALFSCVFLIGLMHDLRRVIAQQGYPRLDIEVDFEVLLKMMPKNLENDAGATKKWVDGCMSEIEKAYAGLEPDHAYVHHSGIKVNKPKGALDSSSLSASEGIIKALERFTTRAIKSQPILNGAQSVDQASSNRQWEIHAAEIKSIQHYCEYMLEHQSELALQVQGIQADVEWRFSELRAAELLRDEQVRRLNIINTRDEYLMGWIGHEEAAQKAVKHAPDAAAPRVDLKMGGGTGVPVGGTAADPGSERATDPHKRNAHSLALLVTADALPTESEITEDVDWLNSNASDASGILEAETIQ